MISFIAERVCAGTTVGEMENFGETIRQLREGKRLSQEELAAAAGLSRATVQNVEKSAQRKVRGSSYRRLAEGLGLTIDELEARLTGDTVAVYLPRAVYDSIAERAAHEGHPTVAAFLAKVATTKTFRIIAPVEAESAAKRASRKIRAK
jgi:transcriptional regulator with XRE-family HTH domain